MRKLPDFPRAPNKYLEKGQALLIVLLVMSVIVTVVLSVVSRSVTEVAVTSYEENALRAFSAAEAGIEQVLLSEGATGASGTFTGGASFVATSSTPSGLDKFAYPEEISSGESVSFWFVSHDSSGNLTCYSKPCLRSNQMEFCWGKRGTAASQSYTPAVEVSIFYDDSLGVVSSGNYSTVKVARGVYDPNSVRRSSNHFNSTTSCTDSGYQFSTGNLNFPAQMVIPCWNSAGCLLLARVRMFYNDPLVNPAASSQPVSLRVFAGSLPAQGFEISSKGTAGESSRKINVFQAYPEPPAMFEAAAFSLKDITH